MSGHPTEIVVMTATAQRTLTRMAHEILEKNPSRSASPSWVSTPAAPSCRRLRDPRDIAAGRSRSASSTSPSIATTSRCAALPLAATPTRCQDTELDFEIDGAHGRARRRRPLHRPHDPRRHRRPVRLRPPGARAARGPGRPRPPRAADPARLRRQEPADRARRARPGAPRRARRQRRGPARPRRRRRHDDGQARPALDRRPRRATTSSASSTRAEASCPVAAPRHQEGPDAARAHRSSTSSTSPPRAPARASSSPPSACPPTRSPQGLGLGGRQGRVAEGHRPHALRLPAGHHRHAAPADRRLPSRLADIRRPAWSTPATASTSTRRRPARPLHDPPALGRDLDGLKVGIVGDILHCRVARSDIAGSSSWARTSPSSARRRSSRGRRGPRREGRVTLDASPRPTSSTCCASRRSAWRRARTSALAARVLGALRPDARAPAARPEGHAPGPDQPRRRDQPGVADGPDS